jgi:hypothetical protein
VITDFHAKYFAYELGRRCSSDSVEKLTAVLADAQVDLNPHQIEAALFAFRSPFSKGAILADEVGLGKTNPFPGETINSGPYRMGKGVEDANTYRVGHPLAQRVLARARELELEPADVVLDYAGSGKNIAVLEPLRGRSGWLACAHVSMSALESEDQLVFAGVTDDGEAMDQAQCRRLFDLPAEAGAQRPVPDAVAAELDRTLMAHRQTLLAEMTARDGRSFDAEMDKLDRWAEDRRDSLKAELADMDEALKEARKLARFAPTLPEKLERQRAARKLEEKREEAWRAYDEASRDIDRQKDDLLDEIGTRLEQSVEETPLFTMRWRLT